jgi:pilus assembly protein CpaC
MLHLNADAGRVSIADPEVAEVILISPREVVVNGKGRKSTRTSSNVFTGASATEEVISEAQTSVIVWDRNGRSEVRTLYVNRARSEQILLEVTVADLNRTAMENYGFDFQVLQGNILFSGTPSKIFNFDQLNPVLNAGATVVNEELNVNSDRLTYMIHDLDNNFLAFIEVMQRENMARILARPMILARSGEQAHFRVGGEVPVVYATQNVAQVNFKEFGVLLGVTPTLTDDGKIDLRIATEVSEPSTAFASAVVEGFQVPSFISRRAETRVTLRDGEPLLVGGLYREDNVEQEDKVPYMGDIPFLGFFFRRTHFETNRNELLILVKPRVAHSGGMLSPQSLPTDRPPLSREEVRTQQNPYGVTRPRLTTPPGPTRPVPGVKRDQPSIEQYLPPQE